MKNPLSDIFDEMKSLSEKEVTKTFINYCFKLIELKNKNVLSEEEAAYWIVGCLFIDKISKIPEFENIFDIAGDVEIPRTSSYRLGIGNWNQKDADALKKKEWGMLVGEISKIKEKFS